MSIKNVVFDLGGVMINYNPREFIEQLGYDKELGDRLCDAIFQDPVWADMDLGKYMRYTDALPVFIARHPDLEVQIRHFFEPGWMDVYTQKLESEENLFNWVYDKGLDIYILSNYSADGFNYIKSKYPFFKKMKGYVVSAFEKCVKPQPEIYRILLDRYGLNPQETVFIDDMEKNIEGARSVGMHGIVFKSADQTRKALENLGV